ncbi:MAG: DUF2817 domain-containing protein [Kineosporiaceae bacterium]|nr:DUF2817 domain-containing protein [Kineosporiaceae bacterium]
MTAQVRARRRRWDGVHEPLTRRALIVGLLSGVATVASEVAHPVVARAEAAPTGPAPGRRLLGRSTQGRSIWVHQRGPANAAATVLVVGSIHGSEPAGIPIAQALLTQAPPFGVRFVVVPTMNPDGDALRRRQNARGVDLNRNFPGGVHRGTPGDVYYSGPRDASEVETRLMRGLMEETQPDAMLVYHQHLNVVDHCGGDLAVSRAYASQTGMRAAQLPRYPGSMATWLHRLLPTCTIVTVELPAAVGTALRRRHVTAVRRLAVTVAASG